MDRRQMIAQRTRELFGDRLEDVLHIVRQDRQELRGWQEPAHVRGAARRIIREAGSVSPETEMVTMLDVEIGCRAGEPDRGQQREATGQLLEAGLCGLEKVVRSAVHEISPEEILGIECIILLYVRPAVLVTNGRLASPPPVWNLLEDQREDVELATRGVGRIELLGHPEYDWAGTGFLVNETTLLTTRRIAECFIEQRSGNWAFRPGISAWMDYRSEYQGVSTAGFRVRAVIGVHPYHDLALLEVEPPQINGTAPTPLAVAAEPPPRVEGRPVYLIGYPVRDARRSEPEMITRIFRDVYNVKRVQPGLLRGQFRFNEIELLRHDCAPLGQNAGGCIVDLETHQVLGVQVSGRYLEQATAIPLWTLRDDPLLKRAGVTFAQATAHDRQLITEQLERLARSRYWPDVRNTIANLYQRAFGGSDIR
jgi:hypothetical protein